MTSRNIVSCDLAVVKHLLNKLLPLSSAINIALHLRAIAQTFLSSAHFTATPDTQPVD